MGEGTALIGAWLGQELVPQDAHRGSLLLGVAALYWVRHVVTLFYLLVRKVAWGEVLGLSCFILFFEVGLCLVAMGLWRGRRYPSVCLTVWLLDLSSSARFLIRVLRCNENGGNRIQLIRANVISMVFFAWSMHINYFGDTLLFTGWCLLTGLADIDSALVYGIEFYLLPYPRSRRLPR